MRISYLLGTAALGLALIGGLAACGDDDDDATAGTAAATSAAAPASSEGAGEATAAAGEGGKLTLVAYSTPREAYAAQIEAFKALPAGAGVEFEESYGASGDQSRAVDAGLAADIVAFSLEPDMTRLVESDLVDASWNTDAHKGMITDSVVVFLVREGNPKNIKTWDDLIRDDVEVLNPNPFVSGGARWNVMAAYGAQLEAGKTEEEALDYLDKLFRNVVVQSKSAREMLQAFVEGKGDVALAYENEAITAQQAGEPFEYVVPDATLLIENPIAVLKNSGNAATAQAFVDYLRTPEGQRVYAEKGYRPVDEAVLAEFPVFTQPPQLFTIEKFGGWSTVMDTFFDRDKGKVAEIFRELGVPTDG